MQIVPPYLMFLGDAVDQLAAKTAQGIVDWCPDICIGQIRMPDCNADLGLTDMTLYDAKEKGANTLIVGVANRGGIIGEAWVKIFLEALDLGFDIASGLHHKLVDIPAIEEIAVAMGQSLFDVRHPTNSFSLGNGKKRSGKRLLQVGTDCSVGKMYTALAIAEEMKHRGIKASFRATGQTGIFIAGEGVSIDAVVSDFISGAVEELAPDNDHDHWDIIEGQGSLFHASFAGVTAGLIHGSQPDVLVLCHEPTRKHMRGLPGFPLPDLDDCMRLNLEVAKLTNPAARFIGISMNTSNLEPGEADKLLDETSEKFGLPCVDPMRGGVGPLVDRLSN